MIRVDVDEEEVEVEEKEFRNVIYIIKMLIQCKY